MKTRQQHKTTRPNVNRRESDLKTLIENAEQLLLASAAKGDADRVRVLLLHSAADVDARNSKGETALILAAAHDHIDVVHILKRFHADPFALDSNNLTARGRAEKARHDRITRALEIYEHEWTKEHSEPEVVHSD